MLRQYLYFSCHLQSHPLLVDEMFMLIFKLDLVRWLPVALDLDDLQANRGESPKSGKLKIQSSRFIGHF